MSQNNSKKKRNVGQYLKSNDWSDYWRTEISQAPAHRILIRGYPLPEICGNLTFAETLYLTLKGELPTPTVAKMLDAVLCCVIDHQFITSTVVTGRFIASAFPDSPVPGIAGSILTAGRNTWSPQESANLINESYDRMKAEGLTIEQMAERVAGEYAEQRKQMPGMGHPTHKEFDPRAARLIELAKDNDYWGEKSQLYAAIHEAYNRITGRNLCLNADGAMACVMNEMGLKPMEMVGVAVLAYMPGIIAHVIEEIEDGVPLRIIPEELGSKYIGPEFRHLPADRLKNPTNVQL
ncbi:MAG: citryl-CoA lyase [Chloroflexota bacterium]|nr:MAG: citryl-CoA lyase [Chloroflexota bacterium]